MPFFDAISRAVREFEHPADVAKEAQAAVGAAGKVIQKAVKVAAPRAKVGSHLPPGRKAGMLRAAVRVKRSGSGFDASAAVRAGGLGPVIIGGTPAHPITPNVARALSLASTGPVYARVQHPAITGVPYLEIGAAAAMTAVETIMEESGHRIVTAMARSIQGGL